MTIEKFDALGDDVCNLIGEYVYDPDLQFDPKWFSEENYVGNGEAYFMIHVLDVRSTRFPKLLPHYIRFKEYHCCNQIIRGLKGGTHEQILFFIRSSFYFHKPVFLEGFLRIMKKHWPHKRNHFIKHLDDNMNAQCLMKYYESLPSFMHTERMWCQELFYNNDVQLKDKHFVIKTFYEKFQGIYKVFYFEAILYDHQAIRNLKCFKHNVQILLYLVRHDKTETLIELMNDLGYYHFKNQVFEEAVKKRKKGPVQYLCSRDDFNVIGAYVRSVQLCKRVDRFPMLILSYLPEPMKTMILKNKYNQSKIK